MIEKIDAAVKITFAAYNHTVSAVEGFFERNLHLTKCDYAILAQKELTPLQFKPAMQLFSGRAVDYGNAVYRQMAKDGIIGSF